MRREATVRKSLGGPGILMRTVSRHRIRQATASAQ